MIGVGGLGCPAALALARAGIELLLCDDDHVDESNLPRQILFSDADVGEDKLDAAERALSREARAPISLARTRFLPETAARLVADVDVVVEGADNFATKFLAADAALLAHKPIVHGAGVRLHGTAMSVSAQGGPCYRCLFEDVLPADSAPNCAEAGVLGPVVGFVGALMADLAIDLARGKFDRCGAIWSFDAGARTLRETRISARSGCPLCSNARRISELDETRYLSPTFSPECHSSRS